MSETKFPAELVEKIADALAPYMGSSVLSEHREAAIAVLDASGHSKLVAALEEARAWLDASLGLVRGEGPPNWDGIREELGEIDAALALAGYRTDGAVR